VSGNKIFPGFERTLNTNAPDGVLAQTVNLTVTETEGALGGCLALFPGDIAWPGTSSVNWFGPNQILANNAIVRIPDTKLIKLHCGGTGPTHIVIDLIATSVLTDVGVASLGNQDFPQWSVVSERLATRLCLTGRRLFLRRVEQQLFLRESGVTPSESPLYRSVPVSS
jgi:hypothetical protein